MIRETKAVATFTDGPHSQSKPSRTGEEEEEEEEEEDEEAEGQ